MPYEIRTEKTEGYAVKQRYDIGYEKKSESVGIMYEKNEVLRPLPKVGEYVKVEEQTWRASDLRNMISEEPEWKVDENHRDAYDRPIIYRVEGYTMGIDRPLDNKNKVILKESEYPLGKLFRKPGNTEIRTILLTSSHMRLTTVDISQYTCKKDGVRVLDGTWI